MVDEQDKKFVKETEELLDSLNLSYELENDAGKWQLEPQIETAITKWAQARIKLLKEGTLAKDTDMAELRRIKGVIDQAADTQALIIGAVQLVALLSKFV